MIPTFFGITLIGFLIMRLAPGDPAELRAAGGLAGAAGAGVALDKRVSIDEAVAQWRTQYGLDRPLHVQYAIWLKNVLTLNFGESFKDNQPVWSKIIERLPITIQLNIYSILLVYLVAIPLGIYSATQRNTLGDQMTTVAAFILFAVPTVWAATMALVFICGGDFFYLFPPGGLNSIDYEPDWPLWRKFNDKAWHLFLPVVLLSYGGFAGLSRYMRAGMLEVLGQDYVQVARAKGLLERVVIMKHVLRNSLIPLVTMLAALLPAFIGGSVIIETIFSIPGLGQLGYESVRARDYPTVMALYSVTAVLTLIGILISDLLLSVVDPRIAFGRRLT
jgi:peptide/nickel transport system permease protein